MANIYMAAHTNIAIPTARDPITISASKKKCVRIPFSSQGYLVHFVVYQVPAADGGGTPAAFTVDLLTSKVPFAPGEYDVSDDPAAPLEAFRFIPPIDAPLSGGAGDIVTFAAEAYGAAFVNADKPSVSEEERYLYLIITPTSAEQTVWCAYLRARTESRV